MLTITIDQPTKPISQIDFQKGLLVFHCRREVSKVITIVNDERDIFSISEETKELFQLCFPEQFHILLMDAFIETVSKYNISDKTLYLWKVFRYFLLDQEDQLLTDSLKHEDIFRAMMFPQRLLDLCDAAVKLGKFDFAEKLQSYNILS